ncbi:TcfC E-set like domain-containing protein [Yersinia massiliensis]|uniref:TcfC E-set like domain-containing protein n=1 Tax=Yersinia TaxID=629 RepID=UPI0005E3C657|nr:alpha-related fimbriae usher protein [Yersinia frederiksenii]HEC1648307.1 TcfC E-set like domain-containing protein [Yersinia enterocolitica]
MKNKTNKIIFSTILLLILSSGHAEDITIEHLIPPGFSPVEEHNTLQLLGVLDGKTLPAPIFYSEEKQQLTFDKKKYQLNKIGDKSILLLDEILPQIPYLQCKTGCDYILSGHNVMLDKVNNVITINNNNNRYLMPSTTWGLVHNQSFDLRMTAKNYRAISGRGQGYIGLPLQSYGFVNWFYNTTRSKNSDQQWNIPRYQHHTQKGIDSGYLQKNFQALYFRVGKQNNLDNSAGSINTLINPALNQFITLGSQSYLALDRLSAGSLVLYATTEGDYEFYRDNQLIRRIPAQLGRNEINYNQLPGGYYNVDIRLVDHTGRIVSQESQIISNISAQTHYGWFVTMGKGSTPHHRTSPYLVQFGRSMKIENLQTNISLLKDNAQHWAAEGNISRPWGFADLTITPSLGMMSGEKHGGGYLRLNGGNTALGYLSVARYQTPDVSIYAPSYGSTSVSYSRRFGPTQLSYQFNQYQHNRQHRLQSSWDWRQPQFGLNLSLGIQKGSQWISLNNASVGRTNDYSVFLNTTFSLRQSSANINSAYAQQQLTTSASYQKEFTDSHGNSSLGIDGSTSRNSQSIGSFVHRTGSRGDVSARAGIDSKIANGGFSYNGMLSISPQGMALGRSSYSGSALLIETPELSGTPYSFHAEGHPITGAGRYAIPLPRYQDRYFIRTHNDRSDLDMHIQLPVNIVRAHPGQVFSSKADITLELLYNGFLKNVNGLPVTGVIQETGDNVHPNGLFSISSSTILSNITVQSGSTLYRCNMRQQRDHIYRCDLIQSQQELL